MLEFKNTFLFFYTDIRISVKKEITQVKGNWKLGLRQMLISNDKFKARTFEKSKSFHFVQIAVKNVLSKVIYLAK
jgi:hypothetical protein